MPRWEKTWDSAERDYMMTPFGSGHEDHKTLKAAKNSAQKRYTDWRQRKLRELMRETR